MSQGARRSGAQPSRRVEIAMALGLAGLLLTIGLTWGLAEPVGSGGQSHGSFDTLQRSADGIAQRADLILLGWIAGLFEILVLVCALALGLRRAGLEGAETGRPVAGSPQAGAPWAGWLWAGGLLFAAVWSALVFSYQLTFGGPGAPDPQSLRAVQPLWGSLPIPTAIMLYGLWPVPLVFVALYVWRFDAWVLSEADLAEVERIRARRVASGREGEP